MTLLIWIMLINYIPHKLLTAPTLKKSCNFFIAKMQPPISPSLIKLSPLYFSYKFSNFHHLNPFIKIQNTSLKFLILTSKTKCRLLTQNLHLFQILQALFLLLVHLYIPSSLLSFLIKLSSILLSLSLSPNFS